MPIAEQIYWLVILSIVVACVSWTVTQEDIFRGWRESFERRSKTAHSSIARKFYYIFICEYCFSHWVTLLVLLLTNFSLLIDDWRGYVIAFFVLPWLANQLMSIYRRLRVDIKHENALAEKVERENGRSR